MLVHAQPPWLMPVHSQPPPVISYKSRRKNLNFPPLPLPGLVGLGEQEVYELECPQHQITLCVGSTGTWLITVDKHFNIRIMNLNVHKEHSEVNLCQAKSKGIHIYVQILS
ncbi:hypothetical protein IFM89_014958 [Coptis chinensis]|uniref:Uncharacterized protein n=1 Tax=Coptis chinensis TaxID=261450 RepID=A0A835H8J3_9MAGN|nr:hypothetical protein IFM89_014958 [Coptis chinensis]